MCACSVSSAVAEEAHACTKTKKIQTSLYTYVNDLLLLVLCECERICLRIGILEVRGVVSNFYHFLYASEFVYTMLLTYVWEAGPNLVEPNVEILLLFFLHFFFVNILFYFLFNFFVLICINILLFFSLFR